MKIYVFRENDREPMEIEAGENESAAEVLSRFKQQLPGGEQDGYEAFIEDESDDHADHTVSKSKKLHPNDRIQCHRCLHIDVELVYNGQRYQRAFQPSATGKQILAKLPSIIKGISPRDAANLQLEITPGTYLEKNDHLGSFVAYPHCHIRLQLVSKTNVQG